MRNGLDMGFTVPSNQIKSKIDLTPFYDIEHHHGLFATLASLFEDIDFATWIALKSQVASKAEYPSIAKNIREQISSARDRHKESRQRKDLKRLIALYEQLSAYSPGYEQKIIRKKLLPLYLKDFQFKKHAHWRQQLEN